MFCCKHNYLKIDIIKTLSEPRIISRYRLCKLRSARRLSRIALGRQVHLPHGAKRRTPTAIGLPHVLWKPSSARWGAGGGFKKNRKHRSSSCCFIGCPAPAVAPARLQCTMGYDGFSAIRYPLSIGVVPLPSDPSANAVEPRQLATLMGLTGRDQPSEGTPLFFLNTRQDQSAPESSRSPMP